MDFTRHTVRWAGPDGFHDLAWTHWGARNLQHRAICVHGLTRTGRDFDALAQRLVLHGYQVACPDLPGRGRSERLRDAALYQPPTYVTALTHLLAALDWRSCAWIGTSLGGIVGMLAAALPGTPVARLVLNDIGAEISRAALLRIAEYLSHVPSFDTIAALEAHLREVHAPFGKLTDAEWRHLAETSAVRGTDGRVALHYDPAIAQGFAVPDSGDITLWPIWDRVQVPTLLLRGADSDLLSEAVARRMAARPGVELATIAGAGHAPALMDHAQLARVAAFLDG
jgi:pimeloyl-ACP methyl ester carboxylesterase